MMGEQMSDQELMTGVSTKPHKRILAAMNMLERASSPEGLISAAADTYPYVKAAIITAVRKDANKIAELEDGLRECTDHWTETGPDGKHIYDTADCIEQVNELLGKEQKT